MIIKHLFNKADEQAIMTMNRANMMQLKYSILEWFRNKMKTLMKEINRMFPKSCPNLGKRLEEI